MIPDVRKSPNRIAVFGAGIAGLTVAHELARRGHHVDVFEALDRPGGFFRSGRTNDPKAMPTEYSWHGFGPWYHNTFDILKQIPFDRQGSIYDRGLSRPIDFGLAPDQGKAEFNRDCWTVPVSRMFRMRGFDSARWGWLMWKTWTAGRRSHESYARLNAAEAWRPILSETGWKTWRACFGPWIGSDWKNCSLHQAGEFFRKQLMTAPAHFHPADREGPAWWHRAGSGWLLLRGPSSECWFQRWTDYLQDLGVQFHWNAPLHELVQSGDDIAGVRLADGTTVTADAFVLAANPFATAEVLARTPALAALDELRKFSPLVQAGPHVQVSFRLAFAEPIQWPRPRIALILADSEFNLTLFPQETAWRPGEYLGEGIQSLWTGTACVSDEPGRLYGRPLAKCSRSQFLDEVRAQLFGCEGLDALIREANGGRSLQSFPLLRLEVWGEWHFSHRGIEGLQPKWVNSTVTQPFLPSQRTPIRNLLLAGAHTATQADLWSIEGAVESGRRAARLLDSSVNVLPQYRPAWLRLLRSLDNLCYSVRLPHLMDILLILLIWALAVLVWTANWGSPAARSKSSPASIEAPAG